MVKLAEFSKLQSWVVGWVSKPGAGNCDPDQDKQEIVSSPFRGRPIVCF
jgi:hypothetical protein